LFGTESTPDPAVAVSPTADFLTQARATPSFDCQAARTSIERAICSDTTLSEWDARMGAALQNASRASKDRQPVLQSQQLRLRQRDNMCGTVAEIKFWTCLFAATRSRVAFLISVGAEAAEPTQAIGTQAPARGTARPRFDVDRMLQVQAESSRNRSSNLREGKVS
jgi:uncharacterized protein